MSPSPRGWIDDVSLTQRGKVGDVCHTHTHTPFLPHKHLSPQATIHTENHGHLSECSRHSITTGNMGIWCLRDEQMPRAGLTPPSGPKSPYRSGTLLTSVLTNIWHWKFTPMKFWKSVKVKGLTESHTTMIELTLAPHPWELSQKDKNKNIII